MSVNNINHDLHHVHAANALVLLHEHQHRNDEDRNGDRDDDGDGDRVITTSSTQAHRWCHTVSALIVLLYIAATMYVTCTMVTDYVLPTARTIHANASNALIGNGVQCTALNSSPLQLLQCTTINQISYWWRYFLVNTEQYMRGINSLADLFTLTCTVAVTCYVFVYRTFYIVVYALWTGTKAYFISCVHVYQHSNRCLLKAKPPVWIEAEMRARREAMVDVPVHHQQCSCK